jgi:pyrroloquinoline quinone biosynthesis protein B
MQIWVLGSAAGGGVPQWNCACPQCQDARAGASFARPRTQSSIAVSADGRGWFLFNASPDLRTQLAACPPLWPRRGVRQTPLQAVVLTDAELDHTVGLLSLREGAVVRLYATPWVHRALSEWHSVLPVLSAYCAVDWHPVRCGETVPLEGEQGMGSGLQLEAFALEANATHRSKPVRYVADAGATLEASVGYRITDVRTGHAVVYLPALPMWTAAVAAQVTSCACALIDGTCWEEDDLTRLGMHGKTAQAMGHLPIAGAHGSLEHLAALDGPRRIYLHLNNTNPLLDEASPQRQLVEQRGVEIAYDGMRLEA